MMTSTVLDPPELFKTDSARRIDRVIDYFGDAAAASAPPDDRDATAGRFQARSRLEAPRDR